MWKEGLKRDDACVQVFELILVEGACMMPTCTCGSRTPTVQPHFDFEGLWKRSGIVFGTAFVLLPYLHMQLLLSASSRSR
jgi:hypothetical protein